MGITQKQKDILTLIRVIWEDNPELRFCQIIGNCFEAGDNYNKSDNVLKSKLLKTYYEV